MPLAMLLAAALAPDPPTTGWALWETHCLACHRAGGSAPLALDARAPIARKASTIATVLRERFMPPWLPTEGGPFAHALPSDVEREAIAAWAGGGAPGAPDAPASVAADPASVPVATGWQVPADGVFMRTFAPGATPLDAALGGGGIRGFRMRRASGAVERAMLGPDRDASLARLDADDPGPGAYVHADAPGAPAGSLAVIGVDGQFLLPDGWVFPRPRADARGTTPVLAFELHAVGRGAAADGSVAIMAIPVPSAVPAAPGAAPTAAPRIATTFCCGPDGALLAQRGDRTTRTVSGPLVHGADLGVLALRTDTRCTSATVTARAPDGTERVLLGIPRYREGLDRAYRLDPPHHLAAGTVIELRTTHADDNALAKSQPMALLWCAADPAPPGFPPGSARTLVRAEPAAPGDLPNGTADAVTWFDAVEACNARSLREGLVPAYRVTHAERRDGHVVRAAVERAPGATGWRLPRASEVDRYTGAEGWWWTDEADGLSAQRIVERATGRVDALAPNLGISGVRAGMTRPVVAPATNQGHDSPSR